MRDPMRNRNFLKHLLLTLFVITIQSSIWGVSGKIIDKTGNPVAGATITDTKAFVYSDAMGRFRIETDADSLYISRVGFHRLAFHSRAFSSPIVLESDEIILPLIWVKANDFGMHSPSINAVKIHPDTNSKVDNANELLLLNPSFSTTDVRLMGERQTISLLGSFSRHSLVMIDGVAQNVAGEAFDFSKVPLSQISSIEIIKGNSSVYGGSGAVGGIIHIHTINSVNTNIWESRISSDIGSFGLFKQMYSTSIRKRYFSLSTEYTQYNAKNDFEYKTPEFWSIDEDLKRLHNRKTADSFYIKGGFYQGAAQFDYSLNTGSFIRQLPGPINFLDLYDDSKLNGFYSQHNLRGIVSYDYLAHELLLWWNSDQSKYANLHSTNPFGANHYLQKQRNRGLKLSSKLSLESTKLGFNAEHGAVDFDFDNILSNSSIKGDRDNSAIAFRVQQDFYPGVLSYKLVSAIRGDYSDDKLHPTWRVEQEMAFPIATECVLGGYLGTAFSQPSLFDMYWIGDSETQGNPYLKNEESFGYNVYAAISLSQIKFKAAYYRNFVENLIQWRQYYLNGLSWKPFNVGSADIQNYELEAQVQLSQSLNVNAGITFTDAIDVSKDANGNPSPTYNKKLVYTPNYKGSLSLSYIDEKYGITGRYSLSGEQFSTPDNLIEALKEFDNLDASAFYKIEYKLFDLKLDFKVNNILNRRYYIYSYIPQPGINWTSGISVTVRNKRNVASKN